MQWAPLIFQVIDLLTNKGHECQECAEEEVKKSKESDFVALLVDILELIKQRS